MSDVKRRPYPGMGFIKDTVRDRRDRVLYAKIPDISKLPVEANVESLLPAPMDQESTGSCTGFSAANTAYAVMVKDGHPYPFVPSPVFLYREARVIGGYVEEDSGAEIRNVWKAMNKEGIPPLWLLMPRFNSTDVANPNTGEFPEHSIWRRQPPKAVFTYAEKRQMIGYFKLETLEDILQCVADGYPANFGFTVFRSFYGQIGPQFNVPDPASGDQELGGHAVTAFAYNMQEQWVECRNQWGATAHEGKPNFRLSFTYMRKYASDAWTGRLIEGYKAKAT